MSCNITITGDRRVVGLNGTKRWFLTQEKYYADNKVRLLVSCDECKKNAGSHLEWFYEVIIDGEIFRIPVIGAVETGNTHINPILYGGEGDQVTKISYETVDKDKEFPSNGDYQGYIKKELGVVHNNKAEYSGDEWYNEITEEQTRNKGV